MAKHSMKPKTEAEQTGQPDFEEDSSGSYEQTDSGPGSSDENEEDNAGGGLAATEAFDADASGSEEDEEDGGEGVSDDGSDLGIIDDEFDAGPGSASHAAKSGSGDEESSGDGADPVARAAVPAKFTEGEKGASFARAFAKIMQRKTPSGSAGVGAADEPGGTTVGKTAAAAAANAAAEGPQARVVDVPILSGSRSLVKRRLEAQESAAERLASKRARLAVRLRGRAAVSRKGEDPAADAVEKGLQKLATRGVVMLFNAVAQAQRASRDVAPNTRQSSQAMRQAVQTQLASAGPPLGAAADLKQPGGLGGAKGLLGLGKGPGGEGARGRLAAAAGPGAPGWQVLQDSFTGLAGRSKMKDWDVAEGAGEEAEVGGQSDSEEGDAGW
ncbi:hypothetical protein V8C86DRAFT_3152659 [Haematococcus lacustris]